MILNSPDCPTTILYPLWKLPPKQYNIYVQGIYPSDISPDLSLSSYIPLTVILSTRNQFCFPNSQPVLQIQEYCLTISPLWWHLCSCPDLNILDILLPKNFTPYCDNPYSNNKSIILKWKSNIIESKYLPKQYYQKDYVQTDDIICNFNFFLNSILSFGINMIEYIFELMHNNIFFAVPIFISQGLYYFQKPLINLFIYVSWIFFLFIISTSDVFLNICPRIFLLMYFLIHIFSSFPTLLSPFVQCHIFSMRNNNLHHLSSFNIYLSSYHPLWQLTILSLICNIIPSCHPPSPPSNICCIYAHTYYHCSIILIVVMSAPWFTCKKYFLKLIFHFIKFPCWWFFCSFPFMKHF